LGKRERGNISPRRPVIRDKGAAMSLDMQSTLHPGMD
jgi:hypothetical protein